jgi:hypothetical protein
VDCWEIEVRTFDHPWSELDDLFRRECLLRHESADHRVADVQRSGGLLHSDPEALIRWWTSRKALGVANVLHALLRPGVVVAGAIAQPVQDRDTSSTAKRSSCIGPGPLGIRDSFNGQVPGRIWPLRSR